jgi:hypothetical protein
VMMVAVPFSIDRISPVKLPSEVVIMAVYPVTDVTFAPLALSEK